MATSPATCIDSSTLRNFQRMSHGSLPCRYLEQSKLFYAEVNGGEWVHEIPGFVEYRIADLIIRAFQTARRVGPLPNVNNRITTAGSNLSS